MELVICKFYTFKDIAVTRPLVDATYKMSRAYTWNWSTIKEVIKKKIMAQLLLHNANRNEAS